MKKYFVAAACAVLLGSVSVASASPMDSNARMMRKHLHHMMMKHHGMRHHGMMKHRMMKRM